jgi:carbon storage regulator
MLILTRRPAETIYIGEQVTVTVLGVVGNQVRFGIEAPRSITIDRAEIHERKKRAALTNGNGSGNGNVAPDHSLGGNLVQAQEPEEVEEVNGNVAESANDNGVHGVAPTLKLRR